MKKWNKEFDVEDTVGDTTVLDQTFKIILVNGDCRDNFLECVTDGVLNYSGSQIVSAECNLRYETNNNSESIVLDDDVTFDFDGETYPESFPMKGAFLTTYDDYVLGYSINQFSITITTQMIFEKDLAFFDVIEGGLNGE